MAAVEAGRLVAPVPYWEWKAARRAGRPARRLAGNEQIEARDQVEVGLMHRDALNKKTRGE
jgi:hypothetical protein